MIRRMTRAGGMRLARKAAKTVPLIGTAVAIGLIGYEVKKKGLWRGIASSALDATPVVGTAKNAIEILTGDWFRDREGAATQPERNPRRSKKPRA
jgi:hypothetical protein